MRRTSLCILMAVAAVAILGCEDEGPTSIGDGQTYTETQAQSFAVAASSSALVNVFAGGITVRQAAGDTIHVVVTKRAAVESDLDAIGLEMFLEANEVRVIGTNPSDVRRVSLDVEITVPPDAQWHLRAAAGSIDGEGRPMGTWDLGVGAGSIALSVPGDLNALVDLSTGVGSITVELPVQGSVSSNRVVGTIGTGAEGEILAQCGVGDIALAQR